MVKVITRQYRYNFMQVTYDTFKNKQF